MGRGVGKYHDAVWNRRVDVGSEWTRYSRISNWTMANHTSRLLLRLLSTIVLITAFLSAGCSSSRGIRLRSVPQSPLVDRLKLTSYWGPEPSKRTLQVLRVENLDGELGSDPRVLMQKLQASIDREPTAEKIHAFVELAYLGGKELEDRDPQAAIELYGASVLFAHDYLFDSFFAAQRNPYDPQFRAVCDLYNGGLAAALRILCGDGQLMPGQTLTINTTSGTWEIACVLRGGRWKPEDIGHFEFVADYEIEGLKNHHRTHGLGVPLIAVRGTKPSDSAASQYYPPGLSFPVTAFLRPIHAVDPRTGQAPTVRRGILELYDPLTTTTTEVANQLVPLESDLSTPLAYFLARPELESLATTGLLNPDDLLKMRPGRPEPVMGLYMTQPYEPGKIPVVMVHGLWSSPMTWMEMFNDLRSWPELRENYQFWFYLYPTGQPFWVSASQMRADLAKARQRLDPAKREPSLDQMVLIGHSMGGLVSKLQTIDSREDYWRLVSNEPLRDIEADEEVRAKLRDTFFFQPNPSVRRVVTIGTPHRGSSFSNDTTQWLLRKLITLPQMLVNSQQRLFQDNRDAFDDHSLLRIETSIDSLAPDAPIFPVMLASQRPPWVRYHNIVGVVPKESWFSTISSDSDGVVSRQSAQIPDAASQITVPADHTTVHGHPVAVMEVRRILRDHLAELHGHTPQQPPMQQLHPPQIAAPPRERSRPIQR